MVFLYPNYFSDLDVLLAINPTELLAHFKTKQALWGSFQFEWLQAYTLAKYFFINKQLDKVDAFLADAKTLFPESHTELVIQFSKAFIIKNQADKALLLLESVRDCDKKRAQYCGKDSADWQQQLSLAHKALGHTALADSHHKQALVLARKHQLASWEWWELAPES